MWRLHSGAHGHLNSVFNLKSEPLAFTLVHVLCCTFCTASRQQHSAVVDETARLLVGASVCHSVLCVRRTGRRATSKKSCYLVSEWSAADVLARGAGSTTKFAEHHDGAGPYTRSPHLPCPFRLSMDRCCWRDSLSACRGELPARIGLGNR